MLLKLTTPIKDSTGAELTEIELKEPTPELLEKLNYPYVFDSDLNMLFNAKKVYAWAVALSDLPPSTIKKISFTDMERFKMGLGVFFVGSKEQASEIWNKSQAGFTA